MSYTRLIAKPLVGSTIQPSHGAQAVINLVVLYIDKKSIYKTIFTTTQYCDVLLRLIPQQSCNFLLANHATLLY